MDDDFLKDLINEVNILLNKNLFKDALQFATLNCIKNPKIQTSPFFHNILHFCIDDCQPKSAMG